MKRVHTIHRAFTLVEIMVVIAIIALLVAIAIPAMNNVREQAKAGDTKAMFSAIDAGQEMFRGERVIGGTYIPSATDSYLGTGSNPPYGRMYDPRNPNTTTIARFDNIPGSSLLVYGLLGADLLGTAGFRDLPDGSWNMAQGGVENSLWHDNISNKFDASNPVGQSGLYAVYPNGDPKAGEPVHPRYARYGGDQIPKRVVTFAKLVEDRRIVNGEDAAFVTSSGMPTTLGRQLTLVDAWETPILYYRAKSTATPMLTEIATMGATGIYDQRDNMGLVGIQATGGSITALDGADFGAGQHRIRKYELPLVVPTPPPPAVNPIGTSTGMFVETFTQFIWDRKSTVRNLPVNPDRYLLISAGTDRIYGTSDDVTNWSRE